MMKNEEINLTNDSELLMLYHEDDENAKNLLYQKYKKVINIIIHKYYNVINKLNIDYQEILSECSVGFSDAIKNYNENKSASLPTFISLCLERRIKSVIKKYSNEKTKTFNTPYSLEYSYDNKDSHTLMNIISDNNSSDPLQYLSEKENYEALIKRIKSLLTPSEYEVFSLMTINFNYIEIANILRKDKKQIDNTIQRLKMKLKNILNIYL